MVSTYLKNKCFVSKAWQETNLTHEGGLIDKIVYTVVQTLY